MNTSKPFSSISYNTDAFLKAKLFELYNQHIITFWAYVSHKGEDEINPLTGDITHDKDHKHLFVIPNKSVNTDDFRSMFFELDVTNPLPLGILPCKSSKFDDWYLYGLHDKAYLEARFEIKKYFYSDDDFVVSDADAFKQFVFDCYHTSKYCVNRRLLNYLANGGTISELARNGQITPTQAFSYKCFADLLYKGVDKCEN